jgi:hypothetical protein
VRTSLTSMWVGGIYSSPSRNNNNNNAQGTRMGMGMSRGNRLLPAM